MNTFLPYKDFAYSARVLDRQRLGKQRLEVLQLLRALRGQTKGWANHPAARMWRGYENALVVYGIEVCDEWRSRGYADTCAAKITELYRVEEPWALPPWLGDEAFHASHRSNLLRKDAVWYGQYGWAERPGLEYVWPTTDQKEQGREQMGRPTGRPDQDLTARHRSVGWTP